MAGIYIHIPFCRSKCAYCDFYSGPARGREEAFVEALRNEWQQRRGELGDDPVTTIYLGGGTPSNLPSGLLDRLFDCLPLGHAEEVTIEVNPEDVTDDFAGWLSHSPINRVSMGVQSFNSDELDAVGRRHTPGRAVGAVGQLRRAGIANLSLDLIYGLPGQTPESWRQSLDTLFSLRPEHLSAYLLSYEPKTRLWVMREQGAVTEASEETATEMYRQLCHRAAEAGYEHYEISNFALPSFRSRHNSSYWDLTPYLGLGPGAHSYTRGVRSANPPDLPAYLKAAGRDFAIVEKESASERYNDLVITSLRTSRGLDPDDCGSYRESVLSTARRYIAGGMMQEVPGGRIRIAEDAWIISDRIIVDFIDA